MVSIQTLNSFLATFLRPSVLNMKQKRLLLTALFQQQQKLRIIRAFHASPD